MSRWRSIRLVARREIIERGRSRGFVLSVAFTTLLVIASMIVPSILFRDDGETMVGVVEPSPAGLVAVLEASGTAIGRTIVVVPYPDDTSADAALAAGEVPLVVRVPADLSTSGEIRFQERVDDTLVHLVTSSVIGLRMSTLLTESGIPPAELVAVQESPTVVTIVDVAERDDSTFLLANIGAVLILVGVFGFGFTVLTGVVEEKQSRVVEVVLATVRARDLLMGKVLGIGILGLVQLLVFVLAALVTASVTGEFGLPTITPGMVILLVIWFVLGYALYATALGFLGALASRMEEASNASTPVTVIAMVSYFVAIFAVTNDPAGLVAQVATYLPVSAPFVVPLRAAFDAIGPIEIVLSMAVTLAGIWVLFTIGARIYAGAVLQSASRMRIRDAWRAAGE